LSTTESELIASTCAGKEIVWLRNFLHELGYTQLQPTTLFIDNQSTIKIIDNPVCHFTTKHINIRYFKIRELVDSGEVKPKFVPTDDQLADSLTKPLLRTKLEKNRDSLGITDVISTHNKNSSNSTNKQHQSITQLSNSTFYGLLILLLINCFSVSFASSTHSYNVIWRKTNIDVTTGSYDANFKILLNNPCTFLTNSTIHNDLTVEAIQHCNQTYNNFVIKPLYELCPLPNENVISRPPRAITAIIGLILGTISILAGVGTTVTEAITLSKVSAIQTEQAANVKTFNEFAKDLTIFNSSIAELQSKYNQFLSDVSLNYKDYTEFKGKFISTSNMISVLVTKFMQTSNMIHETVDLWKQNKLNIEFLKHFNISVPCSCSLKLAKPISCIMSDNGTSFNLQFSVPEISKDLHVLNADPFDFMFKEDSKTCTIKYIGPQNLIVSNTQQCIVSTNVKYNDKIDLILAPARGCIKKINEQTNETRLFKIEYCTPSNNLDYLDFIQVKPLNSEFKVYCPYSNYTIDGIQEKCPLEVFDLPLYTNFSINDNDFVGSQINVIHHEPLDPLLTVKTNLILKPIMNISSLMVHSHLPSSIPQIEIQPYHYGLAISWTVGFVIAAIIFIVIFIIYCCYVKKNSNNVITVHAIPRL
jgi:hypothetical protein